MKDGEYFAKMDAFHAELSRQRDSARAALHAAVEAEIDARERYAETRRALHVVETLIAQGWKQLGGRRKKATR